MLRNTRATLVTIGILLLSSLLNAQSLSPTSWTFTLRVISTTSAAKAFTLTNSSGTTLTISSISTTGDFAQTNNCGTSLANGANCTINVTFTPTTTGNRMGSLTVTDSAGNSPQTATLTGSGELAAKLMGATAFGNIAISESSAAQSLTLTNNQSVGLNISGISVTGDFSETHTCGTSLGAGANCSISVTLTPTTTGTRAGTLTVTDDAANSPQTDSLTGIGVLATTLMPGSWSFPATALTGQTTKVFQLTNNQNVALTISSIGATGDFSQTNTCGTSVSAGANCNITVTFAPTVTGTRTGTLTVTDSGLDSPKTASLTGSAASVPAITSLSPTSGTVGASVTITGTHFAGTQGSGTVKFNGTLATPTSWAMTSIVVPVPTGATTGNVVVNADAVNTNGVNFTVLGTPTISSLSPTSGAVGTSITITGTNFGATQGTSTITFNGTTATPTAWSATSVTVPVPTGATTGNIVVTVAGVSSSGSSFTVLATPTISSLSPTSGAVGTSITITGTNFGASQGTSTVTFNGTTATPTAWSATSITVPVPSGATTGNIVVTVAGVSSSGTSFTVLATPTISSLSPTSGAVGTSITITGTNFGATQGTSTVTFSGTTASPTAWSATSITVPVPSGATTGNIVVTVAGVSSSGTSFTVTPSSFAATTGNMGATRSGQTATRLTTGQVLITGGMSSSGVVASAELYSPSTQTFASTGSMNVARWQHTATLLSNGQVLITSGSDLANQETLDSAEIYDPTSGTFTLVTSTMNTARVGHTATLLPTGEVIIVGGFDPATGLIADAELYDPDAQVFNDLGDTNSARFGHTATLLQNGLVLITGGETDATPTGAYNSAEIFDPSTWDFTPLPAVMTAPREGHTATLLNNGQVLLAGGDLPGTGCLNTAEIYDPITGLFTAVTGTMTVPRVSHDATLLNGGKVLITGGATDTSGSSTPLNSAELYDPTTQAFTAVGNMTSIREHQTVSLLNDGTVLVDGGTNGTNALNTADLYSASQLTGLSSITISPATPSVPMGSQRLFTATGHFSGGGTQTLASVLWSSSDTGTITVNNDSSDSGFASSTAQGTATITASAGGISGSTVATIAVPALASIALSPDDGSIGLGATEQLTATGIYTDDSTTDLTGTATWSSNATAVATVSTGGLVTGVSQGYATIQATSGAVSSTTDVAVSQAVLVSIAVSPSSPSIALGGTQQFQAVGTYTDGGTQDVTTLVAWSSSSTGVSTVTPSGLASGLTQGSATITAAFENISSTASLTVGTPTLQSITVTPGAATIAVSGTQQFTATGRYSDGTTQNLSSSSTWVSSNTSVATISSTGLGTAIATGNTTITATSGAFSGTTVLIVSSATTGATLGTSRYSHSATTLNTGKILVAGGISCPTTSTCSYLSSAELYDPSAGTFSSTGSMTTARSAAALLLSNGKVLIAGGYSCDSMGNCASLNSVEVYDPSAGSFSSAGTMTVARNGQTMTPLNSGQVLIAGGETCTSATSCTALQSAELYDPVAGTFIATTGHMTAARFNASAVALNQGLVLILGGFDGSSLPAAAELYDPVANTFTGTGPDLNVPRFGATATLLNSGKVLVAGGSTCDLPGCPSTSAELYDPTANTFSYATGSMNVARFTHAATLLTNGRVLLTGGDSSCSSSCTVESSTELFDPTAGTFASSTSLSAARAGQTGNLLSNGASFFIGGINAGITLSSTESYTPSSLVPPSLVSVAVLPSSPSMMPGQTQQMVATGTLSDSSTQILQSVIWNSSNSSVATISNSSGSSGILSAIAGGTTNISATAGSIGGSTTLRVAGLVSLSITPANPTITIGASQQLVATGTFSDSSTQDLTTSATWTSSDVTVVLLASATGFQGLAAGAKAGTVTVTASVAGISATTSVTVQTGTTPTAPVITGISPTTAVGGTQVTVSGSGFGLTQGSGTVWLGTTYGAVVTWTDTQVVASVSSISTTGLAQIKQGGILSNAVALTVNTATITSISPTTGLPGTSVTINGTGFGGTQGNGQVWLGTANGLVESWSDTQVVAQVGSGAASGTAQILQNGVWSNSVAFTVNTPHITGITPSSGGVGTSVTISGTGFGSSQGSGVIWIGSTSGQVVSWASTQIVATVASSAISGIVRVQQSGVWSNSFSFTVTGLGGSTITLAPSLLNLVIGETHAIQALDASGQPVTGLTWTSSNTNVISVSSDDPPVLTALASGRATITAGNGSADVTVFVGSLPTGTVIWSNPGNGSGVWNITPAVPSANGVADVFAFQSDGTVQAIRSDGTTAWTANAVSAVPDFQGGLTVSNGFGSEQQSIFKLDGMTGQPYPPYTTTHINENLSIPLMYTDGTILTVDTIDDHYDYTAESLVGSASAVGINPTTGTQTFSVPLDQSTFSSSYTYTFLGGFCPSIVRPNRGVIHPMDTQSFSTMGITPITFFGAIIAGDGYAYIPYEYWEKNTVTQSTRRCASPDVYDSNTTTTDTIAHFMLLRVGKDGDSSKIKVKDWKSQSVSQSSNFPGASVDAYVLTGAIPGLLQIQGITNADQGTIFSWEEDTSQHCSSGNASQSTCSVQVPATSIFSFATTTGDSLRSATTTSISGEATPIQPALQGQDGSFFGAVGIGPSPGSVTQTNLVALDQSGNVLWSVPNDYPQIATADGGVVGASGVTYDNNGRATGLIANLPIKGWFGDSYQPGIGLVQSVIPVPVKPAASLGAFLLGNPSGQGTFAKGIFRLGGPTFAKSTFTGTPMHECGVALAPIEELKFYGYQDCANYTLLDNHNPPQVIQRPKIFVDERFERISQTPGLPIRRKQGNGFTNPAGRLVDELYFGAQNGPLDPSSFVLEKQFLTLRWDDTVLRVNCLDFESTDVFVTDITDNPATECTRH